MNKIITWVLKLVATLLLLIFTGLFIFSPTFHSNVRLINPYNNGESFSKSYKYSLLSSMVKGAKMLPKAISKDEFPKIVSEEERKDSNGKTYKVMVITNDESDIRKDVKQRRKDLDDEYLVRRNILNYTNFLNEMIEVYIINMKNEIDDIDDASSRELAEEMLQKEVEEIIKKYGDFYDTFLTEIEAGNIIGLNKFLTSLSSSITQEQFDILEGDYLVGSYRYEDLEELKEYKYAAEFYYSDVNDTVCVYWDHAGMDYFLEMGFTLILTIFAICLVVACISSVVSLITSLNFSKNAKKIRGSRGIAPFVYFVIIALINFSINKFVVEKWVKNIDCLTSEQISFMYFPQMSVKFGIIFIVVLLLIITIVHNVMVGLNKNKE